MAYRWTSSRFPTLLLVAGLLQPIVGLKQRRLGTSSSGSGSSSTQSLTVVADNGMSSQYLIASFPNIKQVAYLSLPDNVWRPLVIGTVGAPTGIAIDAGNSRLFVTDPPNAVIWYYPLERRDNGMVATTAQYAAVQGYVASWAAVDSNGNLYFVGAQNGTSGYDGIYMQSADNLARLNPQGAVQLYSRSNTGTPTPAVWMPSGISVNGFNIFWGNQEGGQTYGAVVGAATGANSYVMPLNLAMDEVQGVVATGTMLFWVSPVGIYGCSQSQSSPEIKPATGLISGRPSNIHYSQDWNPTGIAWDGESTLYISNAAGDFGGIFTLPSLNTDSHNLTKFCDADGIHQLGVMSFSTQSTSLLQGGGGAGLHPSMLVLPLLLLISLV